MIILNMPDAEYHRRSELSSTGARRLLDSPARFRYWADHQEPPKAAFDLGSAAHSKILGVGAGVVLYPAEHLTPSGAVSTKAATVEWAAKQRAAGLIPIGTADAEKVDAMAESALADLTARPVLESMAGREVTVIADVEGVPSRARFDLLDGTRGGDLKSARDASPKGFNQSVARYGYHVQEKWYEDTLRAVTGVGLDSFTFVVVESTPPFLVGVYRLDWIWDDLAKAQTSRARALYRKCVETGVWPGFEPATLTPPTWAVYEADDEEIRI